MNMLTAFFKAENDDNVYAPGVDVFGQLRLIRDVCGHGESHFSGQSSISPPSGASTCMYEEDFCPHAALEESDI